MRPLYHLLEPFWSCFPFPYRASFREERLGPARVVTMSRVYFGRHLISVKAYLIEDTLIDTGLACMADRLLEWATGEGVRQACITHHHEDHSGGASVLQGAGVEVLSGLSTRKILERGFPIRFYQHLFWGNTPVSQPGPLPAQFGFGKYRVETLEAPGHCEDQVVYFVPEEGWLFSGDAFLHERVQVFRRDEDFHKTLGTLERMLALDFDALFCAHRPRLTGGKQALQRKRDWLVELEGEALFLHGKGLSVGEITRRLFPKGGGLSTLIGFGDFGSKNLIKSILHGPVPRAEIEAMMSGDE